MHGLLVIKLKSWKSLYKSNPMYEWESKVKHPIKYIRSALNILSEWNLKYDGF